MDDFMDPQKCSEILSIMDKAKLRATSDFFSKGKLTIDKEKNTQKFAALPMEIMDELLTQMSTFAEGKFEMCIAYKRYIAEESKSVGLVPHVDTSKYTLLIYLNTVPEQDKGCTIFDRLGIKIQPLVGRGIWFHNHLPNTNDTDPLMLHSGERLLSGRKDIIQITFY